MQKTLKDNIAITMGQKLYQIYAFYLQALRNKL